MASKNFNGVKLTVDFSESTERNNIETGENISAILGKIKKFFSDLKTVAFSGSYTDLTNKPTTANISQLGLTKLYASTGSNTDGAINQSALTTLLNAKPSKSTVYSKTLSSTWSGTTAPYTYALPVTGVTSSNAVEILANNSTITDAQLTALQNAQISKITQSSGYLYLYAYGTKPTVNIPIQVIVRGDV